MLAPLFLLILVPGSWQGSPAKPPSFPGLPTVKDLAEAAGYSATDVEVITEDGYSLWMHRIGNSSGPPVMMQHGLLVAGDSWIARGPDKDLAFSLLKAGFDVWLTNQRGTVYCQYHLKYSRTDPRFWNFSFHEAGYYDLPAFIDRILKIRKAKKIFYVGHSQGTAVFFVMNSLRPEYNHKIQGAALLSPIAYGPGFDAVGSNPFLRFAFHNADAIYAGLINGRIYEFLPRTSSHIRTVRQICSDLSASQDLCLDVIGLYAGEHRTNIDKKNLGNLIIFGPAGTSTKNLYHLSQVYKTGQFKMFDYGMKGNWIYYNSSTPPSYPLERVTAPSILYWSYNDPLLSQESVQKVASKLPNLIKMQAVPDPKFSHIDMIWGENARYILYPDIIDMFQSLMEKDKI
ncbi:lipase 3 [Halyomorpha halys]|uniref:lipase 3 n=1 Tax=Halyomorpha halys TaxID=286706 RepID=UPI0006D5242C|nr:lipase 3-like [Halyomorpha halys]